MCSSFLSLILLNLLTTFFAVNHSCNCVVDLIFLFILSNILLPSFPSSDFEGLINLGDVIRGKLSLRYFIVLY